MCHKNVGHTALFFRIVHIYTLPVRLKWLERGDLKSAYFCIFSIFLSNYWCVDAKNDAL